MRLLMLLIGLLTSTYVFAAEPFGRASIEDAEGIVPGQQVHVVVDLFAPEFFTSPPQFPLFDVPNALVTLSTDRAQNLVQTIDGVQYSGIRRSYAVVPEKAGSFQLPVVEIDLGYSSNGSPVKGMVKVTLPSFEVGASSHQSATPFAARGLAMTQAFDRDPASLNVGDALVRTVVVFAEDTQAMLMPPVAFGTTAGVARYEKPPVLADGVEQRGIGRSVETGSTRTQTVVYTVSSAGRFRLQAISYPWFDVDGHALSAAALPATDVVVAPAAVTERIHPELQGDVTAPASRTWRGWYVVLLLCAIDLAVAAFAWWRLPAIRTWATRVRERRRNSPRRRLGRLRTIIRVGDDLAVYRGLQDWSRNLGYRTASEWMEAQACPRLSAQVAILERRLFRSRDMQLDRAALASAITLPTADGRPPKRALPDLNPTAEDPLLRPL
ncbi:BatD family protein [Rhizobium leguminosarum]|uniref:BatD family protein n=1 Tax=Rhizobium leguminosarum TaxID=384 RepID=UPI001C967A4C|nr:BatD family protein [Rhizobium leguminosarum]MBY5699265.1 protein BatD [Rhizobium leguminosarum]